MLFFSAPCGFGKTVAADALLSGHAVLRLSGDDPALSLDALPEDWEILLAAPPGGSTGGGGSSSGSSTVKTETTKSDDGSITKTEMKKDGTVIETTGKVKTDKNGQTEAKTALSSKAVENGITTSVGGGRFNPTATCTGAQIAAFLARSMK
nr:hypothetical protein [uncultured Dysosmobacter sp.]